MTIVEVCTLQLEQAFLEMPLSIYQHDPNWVRPLDQDIAQIFDKHTNPVFQNGGKACRWLIKDTNNQRYLGRIAAFIDAKGLENKTGGAGFFECTNHQKAANLLFDTAQNWLAKQGMKTMDAPINFGERSNWWGLLVQGFVQPIYCMPYNPPYYQTLIEHYGFQIHFKQHTFIRPLDTPLNPKYQIRANNIKQDQRYTFAHANKNNLDKLVADFIAIYNNAWKQHTTFFKPLAATDVKKIFQKIKPIADERLLWFAYFEGEPIAFFISMPDINPIIKKLNGKMNWLQKIFFWTQLRLKTIDSIYGVVFGIVPKHQALGIDAALIHHAASYLYKNPHYKTIEMAWVGDFNPKMIGTIKSIGGKPHRIFHTYRYTFDMPPSVSKKYK